MAARWLRSGWTLAAATALLVGCVVGCVVFVQREALLTSWRLSAWLGGDDDGSRLAWLREHRSPVLPATAAALASGDPAVCRRAGTLIRVILDDLSDPTDPDSAQLSLVALARLREEYARLIPEGRKQATAAAHLVLQIHLRRWSPHVPTVLDSAGAVFTAALEDADVDVKKSALELLPSLWPAIAVDGSSGPLVREWMRNSYRTAAGLMASAEPTIRLAAAGACSTAPFADYDLRFADLLEDEDANVRRGVLLALGRSNGSRLQWNDKRLVAPYLGDADPAVAAAAARVLLISGVPEEIVDLLKYRYSRFPDDRARAAKLAVAIAKQANPSKVAGMLLELSRDGSVVVRLAFVDAAAELSMHPDLLARLRSMAESDGDPGVRTSGQAALARLRLAVKP